MKTLLAASLILAATACAAQAKPDRFSFALPDHPGSLSLDQGNFKITELSAKPNNREFGIRAEDGTLHMLSFLFVWPEQPKLTAQGCRDEMLKEEGPKSLAADKGRLQMKSDSGTDIALVLMIPENGQFSTLRAFVASGNLCGDLGFTLEAPITEAQLPMDRLKGILQTLKFDPQKKPTFNDAFVYATVEWDRQQLKGAALAYQAALNLADSSDDPLKWRRVATDQLAMSLGMSGELKAARAVVEAAIKRDPDYPLNYYNLACADAEAGDALAAHAHLQQAYDRRANVLSGEEFPDPAKDDSFLKLQSDTKFWAFVQTLSPKAKL